MSEAKVKKSTVLIVDDSRVVVNILERMLRSEYEVISAGNGQEALELIESTPSISLVISDLWMPVIDGYELLGCIKQSPNPKIKSIPVIIITSNQVDSPVTSKLEMLGVAEILRKPVTAEKLRETIKRVSSDPRYGKGALHLLETQEANLFPVIEQSEIRTRLGKFFHHDNPEKSTHCMALFRVTEDSFTGQSSTPDIITRVHDVLNNGIRGTDAFMRHGELEFLFLMAGGSKDPLKKRTQYLLKSLVRKMDENQKLFNKYYTHMSVTMFSSINMKESDLWDLFATTHRSLETIKSSTRNAIIFDKEQGAYVLKQSRRKRLRK